MAESAGRRARRGPAPIASFDHDVSDESSPETKQTFQLPEIREDASAAGPSLPPPPPPPPEARARSQSTPGLGAPPAPRIDISRASSSSHHDSRDSSPELALFAGCDDRAPDHLGFREDGALELRSSTEELAFLEPQPEPAPPAPPPARGAPPPPPPAPAPLSAAGSRRHSRKDSQGSEAALLAISGRTSRLSSIGSQCSAQSALSHGSRVSRLSVVSGASRSPSPHKMLLETSFCGPKPIEMDPEICAADVEERLLEIAKLQAPPSPPARVAAAAAVAPEPAPAPAPAPDARDHREVRTEVTVEAARPPRPTPAPAPAPPAVNVTPPASTDDKREKETRNRQARSRERRDHSEPEVFKGRNRSKDIIRIKLKPSEEYDDDDEDEDLERAPAGVGAAAGARKPESLALGGAARPPPPGPGPPGPATDRSARSPSPAPQPPSRKSSFCSLFKSRETIASPDSPSEALRRKKSLTEGRARSRSRDRSAPPPSAGKLRGSVISLFKTPRRGAAASPSPGSRAASPGPAPPPAGVPPPPAMRGLRYYEDTRDGIIHIPLRTPPDEEDGAPGQAEPREAVRPASAPCTRPAAPPSKPTQRTVLPDGSIIIPLHSPTEGERPTDARRQVAAVVETPPRVVPHERDPELEPEPEPELESEPEPQSQLERRPSTQPPSEAESPQAAAAPPTPPSPAWPDPAWPSPAWPEPARSRRKERLVFMTHVGSAEQVFSTQFSITKTPSVASEISESFPSLQEELRPAAPGLRDTHIAADDVDTGGAEAPAGGEAGSARDSSESEGSSEAGAGGGAGRAGGDVEARELVAQQESFEEELPYVPTTLPQERSLALPMLPVRDRGMLTHAIARVERPRSGSVRGAGAALPAPPPPPPAAPPPLHPRLRIRLPRRASAAATVTTVATAVSTAPAPAPAPAAALTTRTRTRSGSEARAEPRKAEWIDFSEVPERRPAARRIQTLPARAEPAPVSYVEPEHCRCECHRSESPAHSSPEGDESPGAAQPFTADLDVREQPPAAPAARAHPPPAPAARDQPPPAPAPGS